MSDTNQGIQPHKMATGLKFQIWEEEGLFHLCSKNKGADQLQVYCAADRAFVFVYAKRRFSHNAAHTI